MKKLILSVLVLIAFTSPAYAGYYTPFLGPGLSISKVFIHTDGSVSLMVSGTPFNPDKCTKTDRVYIPANIAGKDAMLSTALTAFTTGKKIGIYDSGCDVTPFWGGVKGRDDVAIVSHLWIFS